MSHRIIGLLFVPLLASCSVLFNGDDLRGDRTPDAGPVDAGTGDAGLMDAGLMDAGPIDAGPTDAGPMDAEPGDGGPRDLTVGEFTLTPSGTASVTLGRLEQARFAAALVPPSESTSPPEVALHVFREGAQLGQFAMGTISSLVADSFVALDESVRASCAALSPAYAALAPGPDPSSVRLVLAEEATMDAFEARLLMQGTTIIRDVSGALVESHGGCVHSAGAATDINGAAVLVGDDPGETVPGAFGSATSTLGGDGACLAVGPNQCLMGGTFGASAGTVRSGASVGGVLFGVVGSMLFARSVAESMTDNPVGPSLRTFASEPSGRIAAAQGGEQVLVVAPHDEDLQYITVSCVDDSCSELTSTTNASELDNELPDLGDDPALLSIAGLSDEDYLVAHRTTGGVTLLGVQPRGTPGVTGRITTALSGDVTDLAVLSNERHVVVIALVDDSGSSSFHFAQFIIGAP